MRYKKSLLGAISLLALYALLGFFAAPRILMPKLIQAIETSTHRKVRLGAVRINPFALSISLENFSLQDLDGATLVSFHELYLNYELRSLFQHAYVFSAFHLDTPYVAIRILQNGKFSISDLLSTKSPDTAAHQSEPTGLVIDQLTITQGSIFYQDLSKPNQLVKTIDSLDLTLKNFTTKPQEGGEYEFEAVTRQDEKLHWRGDLSVAPSRSAGVIEVSNLRVNTLWEFMRERLNFTTPSGKFNFRGQYRFAISGDTARFSLEKGVVDIWELVLADPTDSLPPLSIPEARLSGISLEYPRNAVTIDSILCVGADVRTAYLADGTISIQQLLTPRPDPRDTVHSTMSLIVKAIVTKNLAFTFTDKSLEPYAPISLSTVNLAIGNFAYGVPGTATLEGTGILNGGGIFEASGTLSLDPREANLDLHVAKSPLPALQPYVSRYSRAQLRSGTYSLQGKLSYAAQQQTMALSFRGGVTSDGGRIVDPVMNEDLTRWDHLEIRKVDYRYHPASLSIAEIIATRPYLRVVVSPDRSTTIQHVMAQQVDTSAAKMARDTVRTARILLPPQDSSQKTITRIGAISVVDGTMNFSDLSLSPNFTISVEQLNGTIKGLSSEELSRADVDLAGRVDKYAPAVIKGNINPLTEKAFTDIQMKFDGIELTSFTPYFSKFAGYKIEQGKLSLDLHYKLNKRFLEADNKVVLNQLTLGDKVESPDATSLPVKLAIALLKDSKGVIDLDVPVSGSLDDPEFSFFPIILKAALNLLWKIVTAPFALLGSLFGGSGDDLQFVAFAPGIDSLMQDQHGKLETVAKGLTARPALQLQVRGNASESIDRDAMAERIVLRNIRASGPDKLQQGDEASLLSLYAKTFKEEPNTLIPEQGTAEGARDSLVMHAAWKRLVDSVHVSDEDLRSLAQRRAASVMEYLTSKATIDPARIFQQEVNTKVGATEGTVRTTLTLTAQ